MAPGPPVAHVWTTRSARIVGPTADNVGRRRAPSSLEKTAWVSEATVHAAFDKSMWQNA